MLTSLTFVTTQLNVPARWFSLLQKLTSSKSLSLSKTQASLVLHSLNRDVQCSMFNV